MLFRGFFYYKSQRVFAEGVAKEKEFGGWGTIDGISINYTNTSYPQGIKLLTVNYYDRYDHSFETMVPNQIENQDLLTNVRSLPTCSWVRILDAHTQTNAEITHSFYDLWGRSIGTEKYNHLGGYTKTYSSLDFSGKTHESKTYHKRTQNVNEIIIKDLFKYTPQDRLLLHTQIINNQPEELITKNEYDELGQLISKHVGGQDVEYGYQKVDYRYNIRGWLKAINDIDNLQIDGENEDLFAFKINYNEVESVDGYDGTRLFNGNISETYWRSSSDNIKRKYGYSYDALNRLLSAVYQKPDSNIPVTNMYNESLSYDKNGNILSLVRHGDLDSDFTSSGVFVIDDLTYKYHETKANQLMKVSDNSQVSLGFKDDTLEDQNDQNDDYRYDENGNLKADDNKGITKIMYNHLNLPIEILFSNGSKILYLYNAAGQKVSKEVNNTVYSIITDYLDGFQYVNQMLNFFPHSEGYVNVEGTDEEGYKFFYVYNYTDHLGNIRVSYGLEPYSRTLKTLEENHYYPFGLKHTNYNTYKRKFTKEEEPIDPPPGTLGTDYKIKQVLTGEMVAYKYKYNGKEWQDELGLNFYDYGARNYDPAIGRWMNIDPLAEKYESISPYVYAGNVPTRFVDFDGNDFGIVIDFENSTITITQTFYTDGNEKTNRLAKEASDYMNSLSGVFGLKTKKDGTFTINFSTNVVEGKSEEEGREQALNDKQGNFFTISEGNLGKALGINPITGSAFSAITEEGGDYINFSNNDINTAKTYKHENLHALGASHQAIGGDNDKHHSVNERVLGATFEVASNRVLNFSIKTTNFKKGDAFTKKNVGAINVPKVRVQADRPNQGKVGIKLKGTIIKLAK